MDFFLLPPSGHVVLQTVLKAKTVSYSVYTGNNKISSLEDDLSQIFQIIGKGTQLILLSDPLQGLLK